MESLRMYKHFSKVLLRCPIKPLNTVESFIDGEKLDKIFRIGIYLSSPTFLKEYDKIISEDQSPTNKKLAKANLSILKYWLRTCTRPTPYGLFAGCTLLPIEDKKTNVTLASEDEHTAKVRLDMNFLSLIIQSFLSKQENLNELYWRLNNSLYELENQYRYVEYKIENNKRTYLLNEVEKDIYIDFIIALTRKNTRIDTLEIARHFNEQFSDFSESEILEFINSLIESQILIPEVDPKVTGRDPFTQFLDDCPNYFNTTLSNIKELLLSPKQTFEFYEQLENELNNLELVSELPTNTIQTDLFLKTHTNSSINIKLIENIIKQVSELERLAQPIVTNDLKIFKSSFIDRYDSQEIPLVLAIDSDLGVGYGNNSDINNGDNEFTEDLIINSPGHSSRTIELTSNMKFVLSMYDKYIRNNQCDIEIKEKDLETFLPEVEEAKIVPSGFVMGNLLIKDNDDSDTGFQFAINGQGGSSAANLIGRFTHGNEEIEGFAKEILRKEENQFPDYIFAEIVHLPQARLGNVLLRPVLRRYELPYLGNSGANIEDQITIDDIYISIINDEIILRSKRLNRRIIPRLTTAHNYSNRDNLPIYKFLCDLQLDKKLVPAVWDWGILNDFRYLPRVFYKNLILSKARWILDENDFQQKNIPNEDSFLKQLTSLKKLRKIPNKITVSEGDNELYLNLENIAHQKILFSVLKHRKSIVLEEFLFELNNCLISNPDGDKFTNELIIPYIKNENSTINKSTFTFSIAAYEEKKVKRVFDLNEEWFYIKLYCGSKSAEKILSQYIFPFIQTNRTLFEKFFFIRYHDNNGNHIRLRFYNSDVKKNIRLQGELLRHLQTVSKNTIHSIKIDEYNRELERYLPELIEEAESLFFNSSEFALNVISNLTSDSTGDKFRVLIAFRVIDHFLGDFGLTLAQKLSILKRLQVGYFREFGGSSDLQKQLNTKYREIKHELFSIMDCKNDKINDFELAAGIINSYSIANKEIIAIIKQKSESNLSGVLSYLLPSFLHMDMNRLFWGKQRKHELLIYHIMERFYSSKLAIERSVANKKHPFNPVK